ncbi:hypothetical protein [Mycolicibacterium mengxianglii]|nr:hypothetical protein [Mycolicibacterium mengxianglii]
MPNSANKKKSAFVDQSQLRAVAYFRMLQDLSGEQLGIERQR